ncbi:MAG: hypothetical protein QOC78_1783 [Solirubrobacteraceae bacterium]|jgi:hypothetical protein|nr:hypothetical protein [Solirubrobacteraceae bacterium]
MFDNETISFISDDDLRKPLPAGTVALVQVRADRDGVLGEFKGGDNGYGPWMLVPFEVVEGEHRGEWGSMMLNVSGKDRRFRAVFEAVTGIDLSTGANVSFADFKQKLLDGVFEAELGPEKRKGVETGFTAVFRLTRKVRERDAQATASPAALPDAPAIRATSGGDDGEDIPF